MELLMDMEKISARLPQALGGLPAGCYLVGGCIRDLLSGVTPDDYDVAVAGNLADVVTSFATASCHKIIDLSNERFKLWRLVGADFQVDFVPLNGSSLDEDLARRDFTINAMAYEPASGLFFDLHHGLDDLAAQKIRMISSAVFTDDPLRLIRAYRFAATLGFEIDAAALAAITEHARLAAEPAAERTLTELTKLLMSSNAVLQLRQMAQSGVLYALFPEMEGMADHRANNFSDISALEHTFRAVECMEDLLQDPAPYITKSFSALQQFQDVNQPKMWFRLKLATLLHDVGKPAAKSVGADGRVHYYGHEDRGAVAAAEICRRLRCSNKDIWLISSYIGAHMKALTMFNNHRQAKRPQHKRALFYLNHNQLLPALFYLFLADALSKKGRLKEGYLDFIIELIRIYATEFLPRNQRPLPLNGHDLRKAFNPKSMMLTFMLREIAVENIVCAEFTEARALRVARDTYYMLKSREKNLPEGGAN